MVMRLPRGIAGFINRRTDAAPPTVDPRDFKAACFTVAQLADAAVTSFVPSAERYLSNFHTAELHLKDTDEVVHVRCNAHYPLIGFVDESASQWGHLSFVEVPAISALFREMTTFTPLHVDVLRMYPDEDVLTDLYNAERAQIRSWKVRQVGDIIFNEWD
jgi:hypothetical protein